jgi:hypothetical protein
MKNGAIAEGKTYCLELPDTLLDGSLAVVKDGLTGTGAESQATAPPPGGATQSGRFYRIVVMP